MYNGNDFRDKKAFEAKNGRKMRMKAADMQVK